MNKVLMTVELEYDGDIMHGWDEPGLDWFYNDVLMGEFLTLHDSDIGDEIGVIRVISYTPETLPNNNATNLAGEPDVK